MIIFGGINGHREQRWNKESRRETPVQIPQNGESVSTTLLGLHLQPYQIQSGPVLLRPAEVS